MAREGAEAFEVHATTSPEGLAPLAHDIAARTARGEGPGAVVVAGGDGSLSAATTALARAWAAWGPEGLNAPLPPLALLGGGTVGTVARNWNGRSPSLRRLPAVLKALREGRVTATPRPSLALDVDGVGYVGFIFGAGLVPRFFEAYDGGGRGLVAAAGLALRVAGRAMVGRDDGVLALDGARVHVDGDRVLAGGFRVLVASVVQDLGLHLRLTYRAGSLPTPLHVVGSSAPPAALARALPRVMAGLPLAGEPLDRLASLVVLAFEDEGGGTFILDGDTLRGHRVRLSVGPTLTVLHPR